MNDQPDRTGGDGLVMMTAFEHDVAAFGSLDIVAVLYAWLFFGG